MRAVFADTLYWIEVFLPNDPWSYAAKTVNLENARLVTTEEVLSEFLTGVASFGERTRQFAVNWYVTFSIRLRSMYSLSPMILFKEDLQSTSGVRTRNTVLRTASP